MVEIIMPSDFPGRPAMIKGGIATYDAQSQPTRLIPFQYNPEQLKRTLASRAPPAKQGSSGGAKEDVMKVAGPPVETINMTVILDATDQLAEPDANPRAMESGIQPALAALELLMYPPVSAETQIANLAKQNKSQINSYELPTTLLLLGMSRVVPIQLTSFSVTEEMFDQMLNPIRAKVELGMKVLTFMEYPQPCLARDTFITYQTLKEGLAKKYP
ncbi:MAG: hypothetical protein WCP70_08285 [Methanothrix sp.]